MGICASAPDNSLAAQRQLVSRARALAPDMENADLRRPPRPPSFTPNYHHSHVLSFLLLTQPSAVRKLPEGGVLGTTTPDVRDHYSLGRVLGKGAYATTRLAKPRSGGPDAVAVKSVSKQRLASKLEVESTRREVEILKKLQECESVVTLYEAYEDDKYGKRGEERWGGR